MPSLFLKVLETKDLSKAGDLFSVDDQIIVEEFNDILGKIQEISSASEFLNSHNDQSLLEICVTRVISAVRETSTIQQHARRLVGLLQSCLAHNLRPGVRGGDPPHAKMASDIMSCLFLNYNKKSVMQLAIPVAVKFLHKGNKELSRNMSSYLSLAAIENADLLAVHVQPILDSVISGNYSLSRVLPSIFSVDRQLIKNHVMTLVSILPNCGVDTDSLSLLTLFGLIAKDSPRLLEPSIPQLCECLGHQSTAAATLQVLQDIAAALPQCLVDHLPVVKSTAANFPSTTLQVIQLHSAVGLISRDKSREVLNYILDVVGKVEAEKHGLVLKEVASITRKYPTLLTRDVIAKIQGLKEGANSGTKSIIQELQNEYNMIRVDHSLENVTIQTGKLKKESSQSVKKLPDDITIVKIGHGSKPDISSKEIIRGTEISHPNIYSASASSLGPSTTLSSTAGSTNLLLTGLHLPYVVTSSANNNNNNRVELTAVHKHSRELCSSPSDTNRHLISIDNKQLFSSDSKQLLASLPDRQQQPVPSGIRPKLGDSRSTGRLATHRSMTRLNMQQNSAARIESRMIHKSMTRLDNRYNSSQTVTVPSQPTSSGLFLPSSGPSSSIGWQISVGGSHGHAHQRTATGAGGLTSGYTHASAHHHTGAVSPTKSMSSGSVSGLERDLNGREILTVDINQITNDLARQSHQLSSVFSRPLPPDVPDYLLNNQMPTSSSAGSILSSSGGPSSGVPGARTPTSPTAPLSLPQYSVRKFGPYSSGPVSGQPPISLPVNSTNINNVNNNNDEQPPQLRSSQDRLSYSKHHHGEGGGVRSTFSNTLPSLRRRSHQVTSPATASGNSNQVSRSDGGELASDQNQPTNSNQNRISVFEPFPMRDTVQHFCEKHLDKIKSYMESLGVKIPLPVKCTIEERKGRKHAKLHFVCQRRGDHCLYRVTFYTMKSRHPRIWIHLMFLALQSRSQSALSTRDSGVSSLKNCWEILKCEEKTFSTLVTGAFPPAKDQDSIIHELRAHRFFDVFEYNGPKMQWGCFLCNHPERASTFLAEEEPVIEGQLKEKKGGKWKIFKKWKSRYFTLSGARLAYKEGEDGVTQALDVGSIRSVKVSKGGRNIPKAFEIFTAEKTYVLKARDSSNAQEWVQCLTVAVAHSQAKESTLRKLAYGGSLGRLNNGQQARAVGGGSQGALRSRVDQLTVLRPRMDHLAGLRPHYDQQLQKQTYHSTEGNSVSLKTAV